MAELNQRWAGVVLAELTAAGVRHAVVCPGSRSTPLALACATQPGLTAHSVIDERSAAFFALGLAKTTGAPAAVVCTSGSAGAHFLPAVIEASEGHTPLVVLTADRPWELHGFGAAQTMPQDALFGGFLREQVLLPEPQGAANVERHLRAVVRKAVARALGPRRGPVQLNVPFREPLAPAAPWAPVPAEGPHVETARLSVAPAVVAALRASLRGVEKGLILCGPREADDGFGDAVHALGRVLGFPVLAEAASNARFGFDGAIGTADVLLRSPELTRRLAPELVLRFGGGLTTKVPQTWLDGSGAKVVAVHDEGAFVDPGHAAGQLLATDAVALCRALTEGLPAKTSAWRDAWLAADAVARRELASEGGPLTEPAAARALVRALPEGAQLVVSSSMPVRDVDTFAVEARSKLRVFSSRGVNGIDGVVSTALGIAAGSGRPTALLIGDVALLHDVGAWVTARRLGAPLTVVAVNNDGGGIFHFLPIAEQTAHFEQWWGTPHGVDLADVARLGAARHALARSPEDLEARVRDGLRGGLHLLEVRTEREANVRHHREVLARAARAVGALG
ncbi:MAG: 2-succinyl-5-enolpyruvyl-6-hydroxy-3-cyclohexene-1-carboxylic-acid synthase [Myxococcaceae bacterium]|nr:2-succinyl-5-enolpyruvyl-6-hydroxy-3-cyclohexene-1-carboxylic-acid synthase [Myxococcaceae bacterium]